jgi:PTS system nitrogen regulatory IIA component
MSDEAIQFGRALRVLRTTAGVSIRKVAQEVGFTAAHLGQIERGLTPPPDEKKIREIARVIGVPPTLLEALSHHARATALEVLQEIVEASEFLQAAQRVGLGAADYAALTLLLKREGAAGFRRRVRAHAESDSPPPAKKDVRLGARLDPNLVFARLPTPTPEKLLQGVAERVAKRVPALDAETVAEVLGRREAQGSTGLGNGVAVPHGAFPELSETVLVVGTVPNGVGFEAPDGLPVRLVFILLGANGDRTEHLEMLARIARICNVPGAIKKLVRARTSPELYKRLRKLDESVT